MGAATIKSGGGGGRRRRRGGGSAGAPMSEINVTPFVDVMLVLLIIFMVAAPLLTSGVEIELPETAANPLPESDEPPLTIAIAADGRVSLGSDEVPRAELVARLTAVAGERDDARVFLRADRGVPYGEVMVVMGALNAGGFRDIGLVTDTGGPGLEDDG
ncbi:protein TolR [Jannaschia sp. Os4]|uniref:protein TolR n=1 Tax=Jannaschia sp. Os4 TaxID=2807617 RepID=UPI0019394182|nr:protein TolR [Jannaschia sp. Os4]MBM2574734.1 protein TolR [Jannaschia sp. Os4]